MVYLNASKIRCGQQTMYQVHFLPKKMMMSCKRITLDKTFEINTRSKNFKNPN